MRVLFATNSFDRGSTSRTLEAWTRLLPNHGVEPIVTIGSSGPLLEALKAAGTPVHLHPIRQFFHWNRPVPFLREVARLALRIKQTGAQLVHANEHEHYQVPARAARLAGVPIVVHVRFRPEPPMCRWLFGAPYTPRRAFFTSETQMRDCGDAVASAVPRDRFRLIYNGLDIEAFGRDHHAREQLRAAWRLRPGTLAIGTASSISPRKRLDHIIHAVHLLSRDGLDVHGFIAGQPYMPGDAEELVRLRALVGELGITDRITFLGYVEPAEPLYHAWDVCVSASEYESFGMTMLEAMACGCPVVAYPGGAVTEVIGEGGTIVPDGNLDALTAFARELALYPAARAQASARARQRAAAFDVRRSVEQLALEYRAVLGQQVRS